MNDKNINFKGYNNVIGNTVPVSKSRASFIAMQLNNIGKADLDAFKSLQDAGRKIGKRISGDIILINSYEIPGYGCMFEVNGEQITPGFYLKSREKKDSDFSQEEAFTMKAFTLIARLLRRLRYDTALSRDEFANRVSAFVLERMSRTFSADTVLDKFLTPSFFRRDVSNVAERYLEKIDSDMMDYFI